MFIIYYLLISLRQGHRDAERYRGLLHRKERAGEEPLQEDEESTASEGGDKGTGGAERIEGGHREDIVDGTTITDFGSGCVSVMQTITTKQNTTQMDCHVTSLQWLLNIIR